MFKRFKHQNSLITNGKQTSDLFLIMDHHIFSQEIEFHAISKSNL